MLPSTFRATVTSVTEGRQQYRRAAYLIDSRHVKLWTRAASGTRKSEIRPCPDPRAVDPWQSDPSTLPGQTETVTTCPPCRGTKKVTCGSCGGPGQYACGNCGGGGRVAGQRGPKNCPSCRGKGTRRCDGCNGRGTVTCPTCEGLGRVRAWLTIEQARRLEVRAHPTGGIARLHPGLESGEDLERDPGLLRVPLVADTGWGRELPPGLGAELLPNIDSHADRIASRRLQVFESDVHHCHYRLVTGSAQVLVCARPLQVLEQSVWTPWRWRRFLSLGVGGLVVVFTIAYLRAFTGRSEWFAQQASADLIMPMGLLSAVFAVLVAAGMCLPKAAWGWVRVRLPAIAFAGIWAAMGLLWLGVQPSVDGIRASIEHGELEAAHQEIAALEAVGVDDTQSLGAVIDALDATEAELERRRRRSLDDEHLDRLRRASATPLAVAVLEQPWEYEDSRDAATDIVLAQARAELEDSFERHDGRGLQALADAIAPYDAQLAARARARQRLCEVYACSANAEWRCVVTALAKVEPVEGDSEVEQALVQARNEASEGLLARMSTDPTDDNASLEHNRDALDARLTNARLYTELTGEPPPFSVNELEQRIGTIERKLDKKRKQEETQRRREEQRQARAARKADERADRAAARAARRADRVQCCDGSPSPSCRYSQGSLRGCCSRHGGVC
ncbi:MAG: hypothetical protein AB1Z98_02135 [Nannocystaceae bacterium]